MTLDLINDEVSRTMVVPRFKQNAFVEGQTIPMWSLYLFSNSRILNIS